MKFLSIKEYFYKLNTIGFILLLVPLMVFVFLYLWFAATAPSELIQLNMTKVIWIAGIVSATALTTVHWWWALRLKKLRKLIELAARMDGYYALTQKRMTVYCACSIIMAVCFFLSGESWFTATFLVISIAAILQWPTPVAFCRAFKLQGSERDMIMHDRLQAKKKRS